MSTFFSAALWVGAYLAVVSAPLFLLLVGPMPQGVGLWWDFSMALGFAGMAIMGVQFALTARFHHASAPFGIDIIYYFHRLAAMIGIGLIVSHFAILRVVYPETLGTLDPLDAPGYMTAGRAALLLFGVVIVTSLWRKPLGIDYEHWRVAHALLATAALILALVHIEGVGYYTAAPWKGGLWICYTLFWVFLIAHVRVIKPWRMSRVSYRVAEIRPERGRAWTLELEPVGHRGLRFAPGQFAWLTLRGSPFRFEEHPFSFSGSAEQRARLEFTIKELGDFTGAIGETRVGETAYLDGPYGVFSVDRYPEAPGFVFIAAGVGIAPIMSMLRTLAERHDRRRLVLIYGNANWDEVIFREELELLRTRLDLAVVHVIEEPALDWIGERGRINEALLRKVLPPHHHELQYFLCGPRLMSETVQQALRKLSVPRAQVHFELFDMV